VLIREVWTGTRVAPPQGQKDPSTILAGSYVWPDNELIKRMRITLADKHCWPGEPVVLTAFSRKVTSLITLNLTYVHGLCFKKLNS
jgi:hypothetical protein